MPLLLLAAIIVLTVAHPAAAAGLEGLKFLGPIGVTGLVGNLIRAMFGLGALLSFAIFVWAGVTWMISAGNVEKIKKAKDAMIWAVLGLAMMILAYSAVGTVGTFFKDATTDQTQTAP